MRNFYFTSKPFSTFYVDFSADSHARATFLDGKLSHMDDDALYSAISAKCRKLLEKACGGSIVSPSEEEVALALNCFLFRCFSKRGEYEALGETFTYVNMNTGDSLTLVPLHFHDFEGYYSKIEHVL